MAGYNGDLEDNPSDNYMELKNEDIDSIIIKNFEFFCHNLKVYDLINGRHSFVSIIPKNRMEELQTKNPELKTKNAEKFLIAFLKSKEEGKGTVLKDALLQPEHDMIRGVFSSRAKDLDKEAHTNERALLDLHITHFIDTIDCDVHWLAEFRQLNLISDNDFQEIQATCNNHGSPRAVVRLIECVKRAKNGYSKFMKLLWDKSCQTLVKEIDREKYDKFKAMESESDCEVRTNHLEYTSNPGSRNLNCAVSENYCKSDRTMSMNPNLPKNISTEEMNNLDGPIALRTRSKTKAIEFKSLNNNTSSSVNDEFPTTTSMSPQTMNPKTMDKSANVTSPKYYKSPVLPGACSHSNSSDDEDHQTSIQKDFRKSKTKPFGFQSNNTIRIESLSIRIGNCDKILHEQPLAEKREENFNPCRDLSAIQFRSGNGGQEEIESEQNFVKKRLEESNYREDIRAIQHKAHTKRPEEAGSEQTPKEKRQEKDLKKKQSKTGHEKLEEFQSTQSRQKQREKTFQAQDGNSSPQEVQFEQTSLKSRKDIQRAPQDFTTQLKLGKDPADVIKSTQTTAKEGTNKRGTREDTKKVPVPPQNAEQLCEELPKAGSSRGCRAFRCPQCNAAFRTEEKRQQHKCISAHSLPPLSIKPLRCKCLKAFKDNETLTKHLATCASGKSRAILEPCGFGKSCATSEPSESRPRTFKCDMCSKKFLDQEKLENHRRTQH